MNARRFFGVIYFHGPATQWGNRIDEREIIARYTAPYLWMVRLVVRSAHARLDSTRCGYVISSHDGQTIEHGVPDVLADDEPLGREEFAP